ncbi:MAG: energy-coupled thiamine transporter ThiT [Bacillota bacterium]|nr:energy-coupled thiamine transporter ThiT [Bacillota bacterium]
MKNRNTRALVESGVMIGLAWVLHLIRIFRMPQGGSVTAGSMIPLIILALRWGPKWGIGAGVVYGMIRNLMDPFVVHPVQYLLDYPIAFGSLGLAGFFQKSPVLGTVVGIAGRLVASVISGVVFFGSYAPKGTPALQYSLVYNASYLVPEVIVSAFVVYLLSRTRVFKPQT